jgi:hypothetical protein
VIEDPAPARRRNRQNVIRVPAFRLVQHQRRGSSACVYAEPRRASVADREWQERLSTSRLRPVPNPEIAVATGRPGHHVFPRALGCDGPPIRRERPRHVSSAAADGASHLDGPGSRWKPDTFKL